MPVQVIMTVNNDFFITLSAGYFAVLMSYPEKI